MNDVPIELTQALTEIQAERQRIHRICSALDKQYQNAVQSLQNLNSLETRLMRVKDYNPRD